MKYGKVTGIRYLVLFLSMVGVCWTVNAKKSQLSQKRIVYKYKKYEKFDLDELVIEGDVGSPGDLSITPQYKRKYKNRLPYRKNFNAEIKKTIERVR